MTETTTETGITEAGGFYFEVTDDNGDTRRIEFDPSNLESDTTDDWDHPGVISQRTRDLIVEQFLAAGGNALTADDAVQANGNIPQEVKDFNRATVQMFYLLYVSLAGDRIQAVEDDYFPV